MVSRGIGMNHETLLSSVKHFPHMFAVEDNSYLFEGMY
jgi:transposase-like protein